MPRKRKLNLADEETVILLSDGKKIAEIEFSVFDQNITVNLYGRGFVSNPIMLSVDTNMLGHTETDDDT
jgi:hypothetical protein